MSPLYDYDCQACGEKAELLKSIEERDNTTCPGCGARMTRRMSTFTWNMNWDFMKTEGLKYPPAPNGASYHKKWDD